MTSTDVLALLDRLLDHAEEQNGTLTISMDGHAQAPEVMVGYTFGHEAEDSDMAGGAAYGVSPTLVASLRQVVDQVGVDPSEEPETHIISLRKVGFTIQHPLACRPTLFDCPVTKASDDLVRPDLPTGSYSCALDDDGALRIGGRFP